VDNVWVLEEHGLLIAVIVDEIGDGGRSSTDFVDGSPIPQLTMEHLL
jgi:hypothetical protein